MTVAPMETALPYGLRDVKITGYTTDAADVIDDASFQDFPYARSLAFSATEEFDELRGDDMVVTTRGRGESVDWTLEGGGFSFEACAMMYGGKVVVSGVSPDAKKTWSKNVNDQRPFFRMEGRAVNDNGGDTHGVLFRCRATGPFSGTMADGAFWLTGAQGTALPSNVAGATKNDVYHFVQNETQDFIVQGP
jgi:hypothetical protein